MLTLIYKIFLLHTLFWNIDAICIKNFSSISNTLSYQQHYDKGCTEIQYKIRLYDRSKVIQLEWDHFVVKGDMPTCKDDKIEVYTGCSTKVKVATICSNNMNDKPHPIYSIDCCMDLLFKRKNPISTFQARYTAYSSNNRLGVTCRNRQDISQPSGTIISPSWPASQIPVKYCKWVIKVPKEYILQINVMDIDLGYMSSCLYITGDESKPKHYFDKQLCFSITTMSSRSLDTKNYEVSIKYRQSYYDYRHRGFVVGWLAYKNPNHEAPKADKHGNYLSPPLQVAISVVSMFIFAAIIFARQRLLRRRQEQHTQALAHARAQVQADVLNYVNSGTANQQDVQEQNQYQNHNTHNWNISKINSGINRDPLSSAAYYIPSPMYTGPPQGISEPPPSYSSLMENPPSIPPPQTLPPQQYDPNLPYPPLTDSAPMPYPQVSPRRQLTPVE